MEMTLGFALGAVGGCILGATEEPVDKALAAMTSVGRLTPMTDEIKIVGPLGLGTLVGATALTTAMTSVVVGVILAAASIFVAMRSYGASHSQSFYLWASAGLAGAVGTTLSGAMLGFTVEQIVTNSGMVGLLWALSIFTLVKPPLYLLFKYIWQQEEACCIQGTAVFATERKDLDARELQHQQRVAVEIEQRILTLENGGSINDLERRAVWDAEQRQREEIERQKREREEAELEQRTLQDWINAVVVKHVDFFAFSGIPLTAVAIVTSAFGVFGYGGHQSVFIALLAFIAVIAYLLLKSSNFKFWMLIGCTGMFATFVIAVLTLHAGQVVVTTGMKMQAAGYRQSKEDIGARMNQHSAIEALHACFFAAKLCQLSLGATVGGPLVRQAAGEAKVILGAALVAWALLSGVNTLAPVLGEGGKAGALLGVVGAAGVSVGAGTAVAGRWSSWPGTLGTLTGLVVGALVMGKWHVVNIGLQIPVAYVFAMTNPL